MKIGKKDTLRNLRQLLGQEVLKSPQKVIAKKLSQSNLPRNSIAPDFDIKFQSLNKNTQKNQLKINFQFQKLKNTFKQQRSEVLLKRSLTLNQQYSTQKLKNTLKNQFSIRKSKRSNSVHCLHQQKSHKNHQFSPNNIQQKNILDHVNSEMYFENKSLKQEFISPSLNFETQSKQLSSLNSHEKKEKSNKKQTFLKKGTSLQKQIVVSLLKNKIMKQHEFEIQKQYTTKEVLSMIKIYKGFHTIQTQNLDENIFVKNKVNTPSIFNEKFQKDDNCPLNVVNKFKKTIQGWQVEPEIQIE